MPLVQTAGGKAVDPEFLETHLPEKDFLWLPRSSLLSGSTLVSSVNLAILVCT